jgi:uncharacterized protein (TIGR03086 family)
MEALAALAQARTEFENRLRQVGAGHWDMATPCTEWNVRQLVNHMMLGNRMTVQLLSGASSADVIAGLNDDLVGEADDVVGSFVATADDLHAGFAAEGGLDGTVDHPMGQIPRTMFIGFRVCDYGAHAWDLARAIGADDTLDGDLVNWMWNDIQPMAGGLGALGIFGESASGTVDSDAPLQTRYLDLIGRRP